LVRAGRSVGGFFGALSKLGVGRVTTILRTLLPGLTAPVASLATEAYFSALPIQFGPYAIHYALRPHAQDAPHARGGAHYLAEELGARLASGPLSWDFQVQFFVDKAKTPIEDASVLWREEDAPMITLSRLTLPKQDISSERGKLVAAFVEKLSFDPWH